MKNTELQILQDQGIRFVDIPPGVSSKTNKFGPLKGPRVKDWQNTPHILSQIKDTHNIGILTGVHSAGILAVDFDGPWAWTAWEEYINVPIPSTVTWTSGKDGRAQMMFRVEALLWDIMPNKEQYVGPEGDDGKSQQLEFRWNTCQSVLPPSVHEELGTPYTWVLPPSTTPIALAPAELITAIYDLSQKKEEFSGDEAVQSEPGKEDLTEVRGLLAKIKSRYPNLSGQFDLWRNIFWATCHAVGTAEAVTLIQQFYPEEKRNEYKKLARDWRPAGSPTVKTLHWHANPRDEKKPEPKGTLQVLATLKREQYNIRRMIRGY